MDFSAIEKLISMMPNGEQKEKLKQKMNEAKKELSQKEDGAVFEDSFELKPKGHIKIEKVLEDGSTELLLEKKNMIVKGSEEILTKAFSGDAGAIIYKIRKPKINQYEADFGGATVTPEYKLKKDGAMAVVVQKNNVGAEVAPFDQRGWKMNFNYMDYWNCVNDEDFDIYYSYEPEIMYAFRTRTITGKDFFRVSELPITDEENRNYSVDSKGVITNEGRTSHPNILFTRMVALPPEIYSTHTNYFIAFGDGKVKERNLEIESKGEKVFNFSGFTKNPDGSFQTNSTSSFLEFEQRFNNLEVKLNGTDVKFEMHKDGNKMYFGKKSDNLETLYIFDGSLKEFDLNENAVGELKIYKNNILLKAGIDYTHLPGSKAIKFTIAPVIGNKIKAEYKTKDYLKVGESVEIKEVEIKNEDGSVINVKEILELTDFIKEGEEKTKVKLNIVSGEIGILKINSISSDFILYEDDELMREIPELEYKFNVPIERKTTIFHDADGLYTIDLERRSIVKDTLKVIHNVEVSENVYEEKEFTFTKTKAELLDKDETEDFCYADFSRGILYFRRVLTGLFISFETTGQLFVFYDNSDKTNPYFINEYTRYTKASKTVVAPAIDHIVEKNEVLKVKQPKIVVLNTGTEVTDSGFETLSSGALDAYWRFSEGFAVEVNDMVSTFLLTEESFNPKITIFGNNASGDITQGSISYNSSTDQTTMAANKKKVIVDNLIGGKDGDVYNQTIKVRTSAIIWSNGKIEDSSGVEKIEVEYYKKTEYKKIVLPFSIEKDKDKTDIFFYHKDSLNPIQKIEFGDTPSYREETQYYFEGNTLDPLSRVLYIPLKGRKTKEDYLHEDYSFDSIIDEFDLSENPIDSSKVKVYKNGAIQLSSDYSVVGNKITFTDAPDAGDKIKVFYWLENGLHDVEEVEINLMSSRGKGYPTNYKRILTERPKKYEQEWYNLDLGSVDFVCEIKSNNPEHNVKITELMLTNGPRKTPITGINPDSVLKPKPYVSVPFSIVRLFKDHLIKESSTTIRVTWRITLQDKNDVPFSGGLYDE
jgi:hypothetical protein